MKLYMFRTGRLPIIRSVFTVHLAMVYRMVLIESCLQTCMTYTIAECTVNSG